MWNKQNIKLKIMTLIAVFLAGIILVVSPGALESYKDVLLPVGCSLLATAISTGFLTVGENSRDVNYAIHILKEFGIDIDLYKKQNTALSFPSHVGPEHIAKSVQNELNKHKIDEPRTVGRQQMTTLQPYYDVIGATCDPDSAEFFALMLSSFWRHHSANPAKISNADFDFVVTPKGGSPILGYEFAKVVKKPFVLYEQSPRFRDTNDDMRKWFDCSEIPGKGKTALIVDDSVTSGTMMLETIARLQEYGYVVHTCFVVFEPMVKNASAQLSQKNVQLVSILRTHESDSTGA